MSKNIEHEKQTESKPKSPADNHKFKIFIHNFIADIRENVIVKYFLLWLTPIIAGIVLPPLLPQETHKFIWTFMAVFLLFSIIYFVARQLKNQHKVRLYNYSIILTLIAVISYLYISETTTTDVLKPQQQPITETTNTDSLKTSDIPKPKTPKSTTPCEKPYTVKFCYGEPNRTILVFAGDDCTGELVDSCVTGSDGCCSITFTKGCKEKHTVRVACDASPEIQFLSCSYFFPYIMSDLKTPAKVPKCP